MGPEWIEEVLFLSFLFFYVFFKFFLFQVFDWQTTIAKLRQFNNDILVGVWVGPDGKDSDDYIVQVSFRSHTLCSRNFQNVKLRLDFVEI